jgi:DNA-binding NtrC family response regulator
MSAKPKTILCVDDEPEILELLGAMIESLNYVPILALNANHALSVLHERGHEISLIISDFRMPDMDGLEFKRKVSERWSNIPFAIVSGFVNGDMSVRGMSTNVCAILDKPFNKETITRFVQRVCKLR